MADANMSAKTYGGANRYAWWPLFAFAMVVGASAFALTYQGLFGYGRDLAHLAGFAWLVPVAIDGATMFAVAATFMLAGKPWHVRAYAWLVFAVMNGLSIAGNLAHAVERHLPWEGAVGSATWPGVMTLVAHLGVVVWRHCAPAGRPVLPSARQPVPAVRLVPLPQVTAPISLPAPVDAPALPVAAEPAVEPDRPPPVRAPRRAQPRNAARRRPAAASRSDADPRKAKARELFAAGIGRGEILAQFNGDAPSRKTVENWTRDLREQHAKAKAARAQTAGGDRR